MATTRFSSKPIKKTEWSIFADFQKEGILTDSIIRGCDSEEEFKVHKLVLCASSPFFRKHIIDDEITYIIVNFITSKIVKYILDYIYKGEAEVKTEEVTSFVDAASSLELEGFLSQNRNKKSDLITKNTINKENILSNNIPILLDSDEEDAPIVNNILTSQPVVENNSFVESDDDVIFVESPQNSPGNAVFSNCSSESNLTNTKVSNNDSDDDVIIVVDDVDETQSTKNAINTEERLPTKNAVDTEERLPTKNAVDTKERLPTKNAPRQINGVSRKRRLSKSCEHEITSEKLPRPDEKLPRPNEKLPQRSPINNVHCRMDEYNVEDSTLKGLKLDVFYSFYVENILCDVQLKSEDSKIIHAHKLVLAAVSQYFRAQFSFGENELVVLPFLHADLRAVLDYIYTGKILITKKNVFTLMEMEDYLQIASLRCWCGQFLSNSISKEEVWIIKRKAEFFRYKDVAYKADLFISTHFGELLVTSAILEIPYQLLMEFLTKEFLVVNTEDDLLYFLVKWILHDDKRIEYFSILDTIDVMAVKNWSETRAKILELEPENLIIEWLNSAFNKRKVTSHNELYRYKQISELVLLSIGGLDSSGVPVGSVDCNSDIKVSNWKPILSLTPPGSKIPKRFLIPVLKTPRTNPIVTAKNNLVYVLGGTEKNNELEVYIPTKNEWKNLPVFPLEMKFPPSMAVANGSIFCSGGLDIKSNVLNEFWVLHENSKAWNKLKPMKRERFDHYLVEFFGSIFCFGGKDDDFTYCLTVEKYEPVLDMWYDVIKLTNSPLECVLWHEKIFIISDDGYRIYSPANGKLDFYPKNDASITVFDFHGSSCVNGDFIIIGNDEEKLTIFNILTKNFVSYQRKSLEPHAQKRPNRAKRVKNKDSCETISESCTQKPGTSNTFYNIPKSPAIKSAISKSQESVPENDHRPFFLKRVLFPNRTLKHFTPKSV